MMRTPHGVPMTPWPLDAAVKCRARRRCAVTSSPQTGGVIGSTSPESTSAVYLTNAGGALLASSREISAKLLETRMDSATLRRLVATALDSARLANELEEIDWRLHGLLVVPVGSLEETSPPRT